MKIHALTIKIRAKKPKNVCNCERSASVCRYLSGETSHDGLRKAFLPLFGPMLSSDGKHGADDGSRREELLDQNGGVVGILFREEVATLHRLTVCERSPLPPNAQRAPVFRVESVEWAILGP